MLRKLLPHVAIVLSGMYVVFFLIDRVNSAMAFINNDITKWLLLVLCAVSSLMAAILIGDERGRIRKQEARRRSQENQRREMQQRSQTQWHSRRPTDDYRSSYRR